MANKSYKIGYRFERKVKKDLESMGYMVIRQGKSAFPDLIAIPLKSAKSSPVFIECKVNKYLSKQEKAQLRELEKYGSCFVAWREQNPNDKRKNNIILGHYEDYKEHLML